MNILYKYCDQAGILIILETLELRLPYVSEVNDPLECSSVFVCKNDIDALKEKYLLALRRRGAIPPTDFETNMREQFEKGDIQRTLKQSAREYQNEWNQKRSCLISVSKTAQNTVMWAHYADKHKGAVIGIDYDKVFHEINKPCGIVMSPVEYSEERPKIDVLVDPENEDWHKKIIKSLLTKSIDWKYENEFRAIFLDNYLEKLQKQGLVCCKNQEGKKRWFLRLNPLSIKEIIFGLFAEENMKLEINNLIKCTKLQHIKLYQAIESETYILKLKDQNA